MQSIKKLAVFATFALPFAGLVGGAIATDFVWDATSSGTWATAANWFPDGTPVNGDTATQNADEANTIKVDGDEECDSFTGTGGSSTRVLRVDSKKKLQVGDATTNGNLIGEGTFSRFPVRLQDGDAVTDTRVEVFGDLTNIALSQARSNSAHYVNVNVTGDVDDCSILVGDNATVTLGDASTDKVLDTRIVAGTALAGIGTDTTTVTIKGSVGETGNLLAEDWDLRGSAVVTIEGDLLMVDQTTPPITLPLIEQLDRASLTINGDTVGGDWHVLDDTLFTATEDDTKVTGGEWEVEDRGRARVEEVQTGDWTVTSGGTVGDPIGVKVDDVFNPDLLVIGGEMSQSNVHTPYMGFDRSSAEDHPEWDIHFKGSATVQVDIEGWHEGASSEIKYEGKDNLYKHTGEDHGIDTGGTFVRVGDAELEIEIVQGAMQGAGYFEIETELTSSGIGDPDVLEFDVEGVTLTFHNSSTSQGNLEAVGPDYEGYWWTDSGGTPKRVFFTDVPCTQQWAALVIKDGSGGTTKLIDKQVNSMISGYDVPSSTASFVRDAVYVIDITVESGAELNTGTASLLKGEVDHRIYYSGSRNLIGDVNCWNGGDCSGLVLAVDKVTTYGNFDGDATGTGSNDPEDVTFFNAHFPCSSTTICTSATYNPLVDFDCDGDTDCDDRAQLLSRWQSYQNVECGGCSAPGCP